MGSTPLSHRRLSIWYHQLAQQLAAGVPLGEALTFSRGSGMPDTSLAAMSDAIARGGSVDDALRTVEDKLPASDLLALSAAAAAGRMPRMLEHLAARHAQLRSAQLKLLGACAYPVGILHFGLLLRPVMQMSNMETGFHWSTSAYLQGVLITVGPLWAMIALVWYLARRGNPVLGAVADHLPAIGRYREKQGLADFCFVLGSLLEAGVPIGQAWAATGIVTHADKLRVAALDIASVVEMGKPPSSRLASWRCFPAEFISMYRTGEQTGQLELNLARIGTMNQEAANRALTTVMVAYPVLLFAAVAGMVVFQVVGMYGAYLKAIVKMLD
jgi:type II secretory pathway component PulF